MREHDSSVPSGVRAQVSLTRGGWSASSSSQRRRGQKKPNTANRGAICRVHGSVCGGRLPSCSSAQEGLQNLVRSNSDDAARNSPKQPSSGSSLLSLRTTSPATSGVLTPGPRVCALEEDRALQIWNCWDGFPKGPLLRDALVHFLRDIWLRSDGCAQHCVMPSGCHTLGPRSVMLSGGIPPLFHALVLPWCKWIPATLINASASRTNNSFTLEGSHKR